MNCPVCKSALVEREVGGISLHFCPKCGGTSCTREAFRECISVLQESSLKELSTAELLDRKPVSQWQVRPEGKACPECGGVMAPFNYAYDSNIILDRCSRCELVWADGGEVTKVAQYIKANPTVEKLGRTLAQWEEERAKDREMMEEAPEIGVEGLRYGMTAISDEEPTHKFPLLTVLLILANIAIFFILPQSEETFEELGFIPKVFFAGREPYRLITHQFVHGGFLHLAGNMLYLWVFGDNVEDRFGKIAFFVGYLFFGGVAALTHAGTTGHPETPCVGASGAISGVMGCYFVLFPQARVRTIIGHRIVRVPAYLYLGWWLVMQLLFSAGETSIAYSAHIGGFVIGVSVSLAYRALKKPEASQTGGAVEN